MVARGFEKIVYLPHAWETVKFTSSLRSSFTEKVENRTDAFF